MYPVIFVENETFLIPHLPYCHFVICQVVRPNANLEEQDSNAVTMSSPSKLSPKVIYFDIVLRVNYTVNWP